MAEQSDSITDEEVLRELGWGKIHDNLHYIEEPGQAFSSFSGRIKHPATALAALEYMGKHSEWWYDAKNREWWSMYYEPMLCEAEGETQTEALPNGVRAVMRERRVER